MPLTVFILDCLIFVWKKNEPFSDFCVSPSNWNLYLRKTSKRSGIEKLTLLIYLLAGQSPITFLKFWRQGLVINVLWLILSFLCFLALYSPPNPGFFPCKRMRLFLGPSKVQGFPMESCLEETYNSNAVPEINPHLSPFPHLLCASPYLTPMTTVSVTGPSFGNCKDNYSIWLIQLVCSRDTTLFHSSMESTPS